MRADGTDVLVDAEVTSAVGRTTVPTTLLWASRGLMDEPQGMYDAQRLAAAAVPDRVVVREVTGTNHYSVVLDPEGVSAVRAAVLAACGLPTP